MLYLYSIAIGLIAALIYIVSKQWDLKLFALISKIIIILCIVFFIISYASYLGYNIPIVSDFLNSYSSRLILEYLKNRREL